MCTQSKTLLNSGVVITTILSTTIPEVLNKVDAVGAAEGVDISVSDGTTEDLDVAAVTLEHSTHIHELLPDLYDKLQSTLSIYA